MFDRKISNPTTKHYVYLDSQLPRIPRHFDVALPLNGFAMKITTNLYGAFPIGYTGAATGDQFLILKRGGDLQLDLFGGNCYFPFHRIVGAALWALPSIQDLDAEILEREMFGRAVSIDQRAA